jgi:hypothetical protein
MVQRLVFCAFVIAALFAAWQPGGIARADARPLIWEETVFIKHKTKKNRRPRKPRRAVEKAPLLVMEYRVLREGDVGAEPADPTGDFYDGDRLRLEFRTNQDGFLYIINQTELVAGVPIAAPELLFPNVQLADGQNAIRGNSVYTIPAATLDLNPRDLWFKLEPPAGREVFVVIFSRDMLTDVVSGFINARTVAERVNWVARLTKESGQRIERQARPRLSGETEEVGRYVTWVANKSLADNEELIETIVLNHVSKPVASTSPR